MRRWGPEKVICRKENYSSLKSVECSEGREEFRETHRQDWERGKPGNKAEKVNNRVGKALCFMLQISAFLLERII